jgi:GMP synthase (glutamine-hydrolysing)
MGELFDSVLPSSAHSKKFILIIDNVESGPAMHENWPLVDEDVRNLVWQTQTGLSFDGQVQRDYYVNTLMHRLGVTPGDSRVRVWRSLGDEEVPDLQDCVGVVGSGSEINIHDDSNPLHLRAKERVFQVFLKASNLSIPVVGICFSSQAALQILSGEEGEIVRYLQAFGEGRVKAEAGLINLSLTDQGKKDPVLSSFPNEFKLIANHLQEVDPEKLPEGFEVLASSKDCAVQIVRVHSNMIFVQSHPETAWAWVAAVTKINTKIGSKAALLERDLMDNQTIAYGEAIFSGFLHGVADFLQKNI